jgi:hypothetical protein
VKESNSNSVLAQFRKEMINKTDVIEKEIIRTTSLLISKHENKRRKRNPAKLSPWKMPSPDKSEKENSTTNINININMNKTSSKLILENQSHAFRSFFPIESKRNKELDLKLLNEPLNTNTTNDSSKKLHTEDFSQTRSSIVVLKPVRCYSKRNLTIAEKQTNANKTFTNSFFKPQKDNNLINKPQLMLRKKTYKIQYKPDWYERIGIPEPNYHPRLVSELEFQSGLVSDEIKLLLENFNYFKMNYLHSPKMLSTFRSMERVKQAKFNQILEETCGILAEMPKLFLIDFSQYMDKYSALQLPSGFKLRSRYIENEEECFIENAKFISELGFFFKGCFEVYSILVKQVEDLVLGFNDFKKLLHFLAKGRYNISSLIITAKNTMMIMEVDIKNIKKHKNAVNFIKTDTNKHKNKNYLKNSKNNDVHKKKVAREYTDLADKIRNQFIFKINEEKQRITRINYALSKKEHYNSDDSFQEKKKIVGKKLVKICGIVKYIIIINIY